MQLTHEHSYTHEPLWHTSQHSFKHNQNLHCREIPAKGWQENKTKPKSQGTVAHSVSSLAMKAYQIVWKLFKYGLEFPT